MRFALCAVLCVAGGAEFSPQDHTTLAPKDRGTFDALLKSIEDDDAQSIEFFLTHAGAAPLLDIVHKEKAVKPLGHAAGLGKEAATMALLAVAKINDLQNNQNMSEEARSDRKSKLPRRPPQHLR